MLECEKFRITCVRKVQPLTMQGTEYLYQRRARGLPWMASFGTSWLTSLVAQHAVQRLQDGPSFRQTGAGLEAG